MPKPFSQACENNRAPICQILERVFADKSAILEIGSGTGQHAVWFAKKMPHLRWQTSDRIQNHPAIKEWLAEAALNNLVAPITLDVSQFDWPQHEYDGVFSANTAHIMSWPEAQQMVCGVASALADGGIFGLYGPMQYSGVIEAESNRAFNARLKAQNQQQGIKEFNDLNALAASQGMVLREDNPMPANNRLLVWQKSNNSSAY
jgi:cyclopropane fatty-acyl-phospholipid synthase-like methyltransferase